MKTAEELNAIKEEAEALNNKLAELTEEELMQVIGGNDLLACLEACNPVFEAQVYEEQISRAQVSGAGVVIEYSQQQIPTLERKIEENQKNEYMNNHH